MQTIRATQSFYDNITASLVFLALLFTSVALMAKPPEWEKLNKGLVLSEEVTDPQGVFGVRAKFLVKAQREAIWSTFIDYKRFPALFDNIKAIKVLDSDAKGAHVEILASAIVMDLSYVLYREYTKPQYELHWHRISGDLKALHGSWRIIDTGNSDTKLLEYESFIDTGSPVLDWLMKLGYQRRVEAMAVRLRDWIEMKRYSPDEIGLGHHGSATRTDSPPVRS